MNVSIPRSLQFQGRPILRAGDGRAPGSVAYLDPITGRTLELFLGEVTSMGPHFSIVLVARNHAIGAVRVENGRIHGGRTPRRGELLLVGPLEYCAAGPRARAAWPTSVVRTGPSRSLEPRSPGRPQRPGRLTGVVAHVAAAGTYGKIVSDAGDSFFVHESQLARGAALVVGTRVSFVGAENGRGPAAFDVRAR